MPPIPENWFQEPWGRQMYDDMSRRHEAEDEAQQMAAAEGQNASREAAAPEANSWAYDRHCAPVSFMFREGGGREVGSLQTLSGQVPSFKKC